jgi:hypothetical protein
MTEQNHETFIPVIKSYFEQVTLPHITTVVAAEQAADNDHFRAALIDIAKNDSNIYFRRQAIKSLIPLAPTHRDACEALCWVAQNDNDTGVRMLAIFEVLLPAAGLQDARIALAYVAKNDSNIYCRAHAIGALIRLAPTHRDAYDTLIATAQNNDDNTGVRAQVIKGLIPLAATNDDDREALDNACKALIKSEDLHCTTDYNLISCFILMAAKNQDARTALAYVAKKNDNGYFRGQAIEGLIPLAPTHRDAYDTLIAAAQNDDYEYVRELAIQGLTPLAAEREDARKALIAAAQNNDNSTGVRAQAIEGLIPLEEKMHDDDREALDNACQALIKSKDDWSYTTDCNQLSCLIRMAAKHEDALGALTTIAQQDYDYGAHELAIKGLTTLAADHNNAREALKEIAKNKNNPGRQFAADALESLETQETIDRSSQEAQQLLTRVLDPTMRQR